MLRLLCVLCCAVLCCVLQLSMNQCSDAVWRMATEIMEANKNKDDSAVDAVAEKLQMFSHVTHTEGQSLADGEGAYPGRGGDVSRGC